jgi:hypothetical protein
VVDAKAGVRIGLGCVFAAWGSTMLNTACGDENRRGEFVSIAPIDQALCEKLLECGCGDLFAQLEVDAPLTCEGWTLGSLLYGGYQDDGDDYYYGYGGYEGGYEGGYDEPLPISLDEDCVRKLARRIDEVDCSLQFTETDCSEFCSPVVGPRQEGEPCARQDECGRGLVCHRDECRDPCLVRDPVEGDPCDGGNDCGPVLFCANEDGDSSGVCVAYPVAGQACYFGDCAPGLRCEQDGTVNGTCVALTPLGDACMGHLECASRYCPAGFCRDLPPPGSPCGAGGACAPGSDCVFDDEGGGTCVSDSNACENFFEDVVFGIGVG